MSEMIPIPSSIVKAVCAVKMTLDSVKKSQRNNHGGYMFASTDDIYAAVTRKMGEVGLLLMSLEDGEPKIERVEKTDKEGKIQISQWMKVSYLFILATEDATWSDPKSRRTIYLQISGPQSFQAAQSYLEKSYMRSLFKIPTGDMDLDSLPEGFEYNPINLNNRKNIADEIPSPPSFDHMDHVNPVDDISQVTSPLDLDELRISLEIQTTEEGISDIWAENLEEICMLGRSYRQKAEDIYDENIDRVLKMHAGIDGPVR